MCFSSLQRQYYVGPHKNTRNAVDPGQTVEIEPRARIIWTVWPDDFTKVACKAPKLVGRCPSGV